MVAMKSNVLFFGVGSDQLRRFAAGLCEALSPVRRNVFTVWSTPTNR